jgi:hypothetical protein
LPPDLDRLFQRHARHGRHQGEWSAREIAERSGEELQTVERALMKEVSAGRWGRRAAIVNGRKGYLYWEIDGDQQPRTAQADPGVHQRFGRGGLFTDFEPVERGRRRAGQTRKAREARRK